VVNGRSRRDGVWERRLGLRPRVWKVGGGRKAALRSMIAVL